MSENSNLPETHAGLAAPIGSATKRINQRYVREAIDKLQIWSKRLEAELDRDPEGVVPWLAVQGIMEASTAIAYSAGQVNGAHFEGGGRKSPNDPSRLAAANTCDLKFMSDTKLKGDPAVESSAWLAELDTLYKRYKQVNDAAIWGGSFEREHSAAMEMRPLVNKMFETLLKLMESRSANAPGERPGATTEKESNAK